MQPSDYARLVNRLETSVDRDAVVSSARVFFRLYGNVLRGIELQERA